MSSRRATLLVLVPGRDTLSFELDTRWPYAGLVALLLTMLTGATARHCLEAGRGHGVTLAAADVAGNLGALRFPEPAIEPPRLFVHTFLDGFRRAPAKAAPELAKNAVPQASVTRTSQPAPDVSLVEGQTDGELRLEALHLGETLRVRPFDPAGLAQPDAFDALRHLMRCRITGEEISIDPRLVRILTQVSTLYGRAIQLVSGHRKPYVIGTKPTSQHALGRAADIRVPGVGIEQLRSLAIRLGARGVGLYPEKGFVHVDVRDKPKYFWTYSEGDGEEADSRPPQGSASRAKPLAQAEEPATEDPESP